jgi:hypothetical protein
VSKFHSKLDLDSIINNYPCQEKNIQFKYFLFYFLNCIKEKYFYNPMQRFGYYALYNTIKKQVLAIIYTHVFLFRHLLGMLKKTFPAVFYLDS